MTASASNTRPHFVHFDSLRGLAVLGVLTFHVSVLTDHIGRGVTGMLAAPLGTLGVSVFFVLSGFLLYRPYVAARRGGPAPRPPAEYARRRVRRILPPYWVALTLLAIFPGIAGVLTADAWRYYGLLQIYWEDTVGGGLSVAWTLCVEASFYVLLPVWAALAARHGSERADRVAILAVAAASAGVQLGAMHQSVGRLVAVSIAGQAIWFLLGMLLAHASVAPSRALERLAHARGTLTWVVAACCLVALGALTQGAGYAAWLQAQAAPDSWARAVLTLALMVTFCALVALPAVFTGDRRDLPRRILGWRPVRRLGVLSYGVFLYHLTIAQFLWLGDDPAHFRAEGLGLAERLGDGATATMLVLTLAATLPLAWLSHRFVEPRPGSA